MKKFLLILTLVFPLFAYNIATVNAQSIFPETTPTVFYCVGDNPQPPCATIAPTQPITNPSPVVSTAAPSTTQPTNPSPSQNPSPSNPCSTNNSSVRIANTGNTSALAKGTKIHTSTGNGFIQQFFQFLLQLFQMLFQQLGNQTPGTTTPTPTANPSTSPSTTPCPSSAPSSAVSPTSSVSSAPSSAVSPTSAQTPTSATSPAPSSVQSPTCTPHPVCENGKLCPAEPKGGWCPTTTITQQQPTSEVSPVSAVSPTTTPPASTTPPSFLQQLLQLLLQLLQFLFKQLGISLPCSSGTCPTPTPSVAAPSTTPSSAAPSTAVSPSSGQPSSPSPSVIATPTIFGTSPTPSVSTSPSPAVSMTPTPTQSVVAPSPTPTTTAVKTGLLESDIAAGTSTTNKLCLDDKGNGAANDTVVQTYACNSTDKAQQWAPNSDSTIRINGKCLDVNKNGTANDTIVDLFTCNGGANQKWTLTKITSGANNGKTELLGTQSKKCLDIKQSSTANGTQLEIFQCNNGNNQVWAWNYGTLPPTSGGGGTTGSWSFPAPTSLTINSMAQSKTSSTINISWSAVPSHDGTAPSGYQIGVYNSSGAEIKGYPNVTGTSQSITGVTPNSNNIQIHVWANGGPTAPKNISKTVTLGQTGTKCDEKSPTDYLGTCEKTKKTAPAGGGLCNTGYYCDAN